MYQHPVSTNTVTGHGSETTKQNNGRRSQSSHWCEVWRTKGLHIKYVGGEGVEVFCGGQEIF